MDSHNSQDSQEPQSSGLEGLFAQTSLVNPLERRTQAQSASQPIAVAFTHQANLSAIFPAILSQGRQPYGAEVRLNDILVAPPAGHLRGQQDALRSQVLAEVRARLLEISGVDIHDMHILLFSFMLPKADARVYDWSMLINFPIFVSTDTLRTMMYLPAAQRVWKNSIEGSTIYYVRTFTFKLYQLVDLLQLLFDEYEGSEFPEQLAVIWSMVSNQWRQGNKNLLVYLRYIGQTGRSSWRRFREDHDHTLTSGINRNFMQLCQNHFPDVLSDAEIHEFELARIEVPLRASQRRIADTREQALIALFGPGTLLSSSKGGFEASIKAHDDDIREFIAMKTKVIETLEYCPSPPKPDAKLQEYGLAIQKYTNKNPVTTNAEKCPITDAIKDLTIQQAVPTVLHGHALMAFVGSDLGLEAYQDGRPFFTGSTRAGGLTVRMLNELIHAEIGFTTTSEHHITSLQRDHPLGFVDLFPWAKRDLADVTGAIEILRKYLQATTPLVVLTFSDLVTGVALSAFQKKKGLPRAKTITQVSGDIHLSKYDESATDDKDENCCVVIPSVHPGALTHSNDNKTLARIFAKTLAVGWLALSVAIQLLQEDSVPRSKKEMCEKIMAVVQERTGPEAEFGKTLQQLRTKYTQELVQSRHRRLDNTDLKWQRNLDRAKKFADSQKQKNLLAVSDRLALVSRHNIAAIDQGLTLPSAVVRVKKALDELYTIIDYDVAKGAPTTTRRKIQIKALCNNATFLNSRDLPLEEFADALKDVKAGQLYYFSMTTASEQIADLPHLLTFFTDDDLDLDAASGADIEDLMAPAIEELKDFVMKKVLVNQSQIETFTNVGAAFDAHLRQKDKELADLINKLRRVEPVQTTTYEKSPHKVLVRQITDQAHSVLQFRWKHEEIEHTIDDLTLPLSAAPFVVGEERYIVFDEAGIDIQDAKQRSLATAENRSVTLPVEQLIAVLSGHPLRNKFLSFWEYETGVNLTEKLLGGSSTYRQTSTRTTKIQALPEDFFSGDGKGLPVKYLKGRTEKAKLQHIKDTYFPADPADVAWLLNKFLHETYPTMGKINMGNPAWWPEDTTFWTQLQAFLSNPRYHFHPHRNTLAAACVTVRDVGFDEYLSKGRASTEPSLILTAVIRLISVLRGDDVKVTRETQTVPKRWKIILDVPGKDKLPANAFKRFTEPALVSVENVTTTEEVVLDEEDEYEEKDTKKLKRSHTTGRTRVVVGGDDEDEDAEMLIKD